MLIRYFHVFIAECWVYILVSRTSNNGGHQAITWTNVDLSSVRSRGIHGRALSWEDLKIPISKARLKIPCLESHPDLPGANELIQDDPMAMCVLALVAVWGSGHFSKWPEKSRNFIMELSWDSFTFPSDIEILRVSAPWVSQRYPF